MFGLPAFGSVKRCHASRLVALRARAGHPFGARAHTVLRAWIHALPVQPSSSRATKARHLAETLSVAAVGGAALGMIGVPAGWLSGAMLAVACAALAGRPMYMPLRLTWTILVLIGISLGAVVTPATLHGITTYPVSIIVLVAAMAVIGFAGAIYLQRVHGWDRVSAFLGAAPGGLSQVMAVAAELGADMRGIAIVQTMRVVVIAVVLPAGLASFGLVGPVFQTLGGELALEALPELAILVGVSTALAVLLFYVNFPGGLLFGAMLASAVLGLSITKTSLGLLASHSRNNE